MTLIPPYEYFQRSSLGFFHFSKHDPTLSKIPHASIPFIWFCYRLGKTIMLH